MQQLALVGGALVPVWAALENTVTKYGYVHLALIVFVVAHEWSRPYSSIPIPACTRPVLTSKAASALPKPPPRQLHAHQALLYVHFCGYRHGLLTAAEAQLRVVCANLDDGRRLVGVKLPNDQQLMMGLREEIKALLRYTTTAFVLCCCVAEPGLWFDLIPCVYVYDGVVASMAVEAWWRPWCPWTTV